MGQFSISVNAHLGGIATPEMAYSTTFCDPRSMLLGGCTGPKPAKLNEKRSSSLGIAVSPSVRIADFGKGKWQFSITSNASYHILSNILSADLGPKLEYLPYHLGLYLSAGVADITSDAGFSLPFGINWRPSGGIFTVGLRINPLNPMSFHLAIGTTFDL